MTAVACFTFDNMAEAAEIGSGRLTGPIGPDEPSLAVGYPALFRLLEKYGVRATFFVEGWNGLHHPDRIEDLEAQQYQQAPPPAAAPSSGGMSEDSMAKLQQLADLHSQGILTDAEFEVQKQKILQGM